MIMVSNSLGYCGNSFNWAADKGLMNKLMKYPELITQDTSISNFYYSALQSAMGQFALLENNASKTLKPDSLEQDSLEYYKSQMEIVQELLQQNQIFLDSANNQGAKDSLLQIDSTLVRQLKNYTQSMEGILQIVKARNQTNADTFKLNNSIIAVTALYEENEKTVNDIYYSTLAKGIYRLDSAQTELIRSIAIQCPLLGGPAVYIARALYAMVADTIYSDVDVCLQNGILFRMTEADKDTMARIKVFPNPADGQLEVEITDFEGQEKYHVEIFASDGRRCLSLTLNQDKSILSTSSLVGGFYFIRVANAKGECLLSQLQAIAH